MSLPFHFELVQLVNGGKEEGEMEEEKEKRRRRNDSAPSISPTVLLDKESWRKPEWMR